MINLDESRFDDILGKTIIARGFEDAFMNVVFPFLEKIGVLWQTGAINPGQEHFAANLIRQKIIASIDAQYPAKRKSSKRFLLFLPEGELHEVGLLFMAFLIKKQGHELMYLGQSNPLESVVATNRIWPADIFVIYLVSSMPGIDPDAYAKKVHQVLPGKTILFTGQLAKDIPVHSYENAQYLPGFDAFVKYLDELI